MQIQHSFKRYEKKFLLTAEQQRHVLPIILQHMRPDEYGVHTICNIYYDTANFSLIRASVEQPAYKEKFRLRSYGVPSESGRAFAEIKKKFDGVVYKRRVDGTMADIRRFVQSARPLADDLQIQREIQWFLKVNAPEPKAFIGYERIAYEGREDSSLRLTFDWNMRWRTDCLDLCAGDDGQLILPDNRIIMEVKTPAAVPLWLTRAMSEEGVYPASFSKYGTCYQNFIAKNQIADYERRNLYVG